MPMTAPFCLILIFALCACGPDLSRYETLKTPRISDRPDERMLVIEGDGDPDLWMKGAMKELFSAWYKLKREYGLPDAAPKARFPNTFEKTPKSTWHGEVGLPVPDTLESHAFTNRGRLRLASWAYGPTAEILHLGPYAKEVESIARLKAFITDQGYRIAGPHEEEYLRGPGMFGKGNPDKYLTLIRYPVARAASR
ncbi:MAG: GyrI-like domain-containing protein [Spirochaetes bacterium]|nr:GyrI-like domain-containing protein [Spirochaetota bacterium]